MTPEAYSALESTVWQDLIDSGDEEIRVAANVKVKLTWAKSRSLSELRRLWRHPAQSPMPRAPGIYIVYSGKQPHYVGIAYQAGGLRGRWQCRIDTLRELNLYHLLSEPNADRRVYWATAQSRREGGGNITRLPGRGILTIQEGVLRAIELYLIRRLQTWGRGNRSREPLRFTAPHRLQIENVDPANMSTEIARALGGPTGIVLNVANATVF